MGGALSTGEMGALVASVGFLVLILLSFVPRLREVGVLRSVKMALSWLIIFAGLILIVAEWDRIRAAVDPAAPISQANEVRIAAGDDGHFYVRAAVNGTPVLFMVDTGATDIVLTEATAAQLGFDRSELRFDGVAETANGLVKIAGVRLPEIAVGSIVMRDVPASVNEGAMNTNLLGMRFLGRLRSWRVEGGILILNS